MNNRMDSGHLKPPIANKIPQRTSHFGRALTDDYAWLRSSNWREVFKNPTLLEGEIRNYLDAENAYQTSVMADTVDLQNDMFSEMRGRIKENDSSVPVKDGPFAYGVCYKRGAEHPSFFREPRAGGERFVYLDGEKYAEGKDYFQLGGVIYSPDHEKFAWAFDDKGSEFFDIRIGRFSSEMVDDDYLTNTSGNCVWDAQSQGFFYTKLDDNHRQSDVYYHKLGEQQSNDQLVYHENDPGFFVGVVGSKRNNSIFIEVHDHETTEIWIIDASQPLSKPICVSPRQKGIEYSLCDGGDVYYILTNSGNAKDFKIMMTPVGALSAEHWQEFIAHQPGRLILAIDVYANFLVWIQRENGLPQIIVVDRQTLKKHTIAFDEETYSLGLQGAMEYQSSDIRFTYSSLTTPQQLFDYKMDLRQRTLLKTQEVPSGHEPSDYVTRRIMAKAADGKYVPVSLYYHKTTKLDGSAPCLLYGYGAYGISIPASFNTNSLSLVNRGFIYAIAHIRGGKEKGFTWYEQGKHLFKTNSFTDFIAVARCLVAKKFTSHDRLVAFGGSAGGMLMGAVANLAPDAFKAIIALVPFVDVLNTMLDASLPLTPPEWPEWGNPLQSKQDFELIHSYSPYDNIERKDYPNILAIAGLTDPRVTYWEAAKWIAKLRAMKTDDNLALLRVNMDAGHGGAAGRFEKLQEMAFVYAFILKVLGRTR